MHRLLERQLRRHFGKTEGFSDEFRRFIDAVEAAYIGQDEDRETLERSMELSGRELVDRNAELFVAERKFRRIFENVIDGLFQLSLDGKLLSANPAMAAILGYETPAALIAATDDPCLRALFPDGLRAEVAAATAPVERSAEVTRHDGVTVCLTVSARSVRDEDGAHTMVEGTVRDITRRRRAEAERDELNRQLVDASRRAGMAEVATGVLHNVGNVLNSINVSVAIVARSLSQTKLPGLLKAAKMLREHPSDDLGRFVTQDPKGSKLPEFLLRIAEHLATEQRDMEKELADLAQHLDHVKRVIAMQQGYAKAAGVNEQVVLLNVIEDSIRLQGASFERHGITVLRELAPVAAMNLDKHQLIQILVNLLTNAKHAMDRPEVPIKNLTIRTGVMPGDPTTVFVEVRDTGVGIAPENLTRIFAHGFTTKPDGHGFGLHGSALAATAMRGSLTAESDGPGRGACFRLCLPAPQANVDAQGVAA